MNPNILNYVWLDNPVNAIVGNDFVNTLPSNNFVSGAFKNSQGLEFASGLTLAQSIYLDGLTMTPECTREVWFRLDNWSLTNTTTSDGLFHLLVWSGPELPPPFFLIQISNTAGIRISFRGAGSVSNQFLNVTNQSLSANTWYHLAYSYSIANQQMKMWINNVLVGTSSFSVAQNMTAPPSSSSISLGKKSVEGIARPIIGWLDKFVNLNSLKTDFTDRFDRRSDLNDVIR